MEAIREGNPNLCCVMDYMAIRENEAIWREYKTGAASGHLLRKVRIICLTTLQPMTNINIDNRRTDLLRCADNCLRIGIQKIIVGRMKRVRGSFLFSLK